MPLVPFETLPDSARAWVFGSDRPLSEEGTKTLMKSVEEFLSEWKAHGEPLTVGYEWRFGRLLVVGVDQRTAGASGCSIDGLFRVLQALEPQVGATLVGGGRVYYRDGNGEVQSAERSELKALFASGAIRDDSVVFDTSLTDLGSLRSGFEKAARKSWAANLLQ
ncbi:MAG TPA: hypothetical protein VGP25_21980 [Gemmatimonadaceae bacterium]|jgi:hypothetical protein|nr:hypothetical protein [Gemmatimonadaceae bacterium]